MTICEYCHTFPHASGCPDADIPAAILMCDRCGEALYAGDTYYEPYDGDIICEACADDMTVREIFILFDCFPITAGEGVFV